MYVHDLADGLETGRKTLNQFKLQCGVYGQPLMGLVDTLAYEEGDVGGILKQHLSQERGSVLFCEHLGGQVIGRNVLFSKLQQAAQCYHSLGRQVYPVDVTDGRNFLVRKVQARRDLLAQVAGHNLGAGASLAT